jgi:hypothetical protein
MIVLFELLQADVFGRREPVPRKESTEQASYRGIVAKQPDKEEARQHEYGDNVPGKEAAPPLGPPAAPARRWPGIGRCDIQRGA